MAGDSNDAARSRLTDAGVFNLPADWDVVELGDLLSEDRGISVGVMYPGEHVANGIPLIKAGDLNGSVINPRPEFRISLEKHQEYRRTELKGGELVMTLVGNVGQCAVVPPRMSGWNTARAVAVIRLNDPSETQFVQQCLLSRPLQHLMNVWSNTTVQATLNLKEIRQLPLPWPPKPSRDAIAAFGRTLDAKLELNRRVNVTLEAMARAFFQSWFADSTQTDRPKDWREVSLDSIATFLNGLALQKFPPDGEDSLPVIKIAQLRKDTTDGADRASSKLPPEYIVEVGDVLFSWSGSLEVELWCGGRGALNQHLFKVTSSKFPKWFYFLWTRHHLPDFRATAAGKATTMGHIQRHHLTEAKVLIPTPAELEKMDRIMVPVINKLIANKLESHKLATLRDTLLPKLLSGEVSVEKLQFTNTILEV